MAAAVILVVLAAVFLWQAYGKSTRDIGYDFTSYLASARALAHGESPYATGSVFQYVYPLFLACILIPLTFVPYAIAVVIWYLIGAASLVGSVWLLLGYSAGDNRGMSGRAFIDYLCAVVLLLIPVMQTNLLNGQVNFLVLFFCTLFLKFHIDRRTIAAGLSLAAAIAIKLFPAVLLVFVLARKRYSEAALTIAAAAAFCILPAMLAGTDGLHLIGEYWQVVIPGLHAEVALPNAGRISFSLAGTIASVTPLTQGTWWLNTVSALVVLTVATFVQVKAREAQSSRAVTEIFGLYLLAMLLISPLSEIHHLAFMIPGAILALSGSMAAERISSARFAIPALFLILFWLGEITDAGVFFFCAVVYLMALLSRRALSNTRSIESPA